MQAIILAAGMGKRLGKFTQENTKCMVKVNDITIIERIINNLLYVDIKDIKIVIGYKGDILKEFISEKYPELNITYIYNNVYDKTNNIYSLFLAKEYLKSDDTILLESDLVFEPKLLVDLIENKNKNLVAVSKFEQWMDGTVVTLDEKTTTILNFIPKKKFDFNDINDYYKTINIYKFSKEFSEKYYIPFLLAYCESYGNNEYYEEVLRVIAFLERSDLNALIVNKNQKWYEIDDIQDLNIAETLFAEKDNLLSKYNRRYGGYWRFEQLLDFCYLINPYFPTEKFYKEIELNLKTLISQYPSGFSTLQVLASKMFNIPKDNILIGNGAAELINALLPGIKRRTGIVIPTFEEYSNRIPSDLLFTFKPKTSDFKCGVDDLIEFVEKSKLRILILINPDNPSGNFISRKEVLRLLDYLLKDDISLVLDESFIDFADVNESLLDSDILDKYPNLVIIKSISKSYGVPGLRLGILASGDDEFISNLKPKLPIWNINSIAEFFLQNISKYKTEYELACDKLKEERNRFFKELSEIHYLRVIPSNSNYFLCEILTEITATELASYLLSEKYYIKDCSKKLGLSDKYIRIAIRNKEDNDLLLHALTYCSEIF